jgi:PKD repeat protein
MLNDVFISGLSAWNDSPTRLGETTIFSATIQEGTNVVYTWDFGDGGSGSGQVVTHTYKTPGIFTAVVTATNSTNTLTATTEVTVIVPVHSIFIAMAIKSGGSVVGIEISSSGDGSMGITLMARLQTFGKPVFQEQRLNQLGLSSDRWSRYY